MFLAQGTPKKSRHPTTCKNTCQAAGGHTTSVSQVLGVLPRRLFIVALSEAAVRYLSSPPLSLSLSLSLLLCCCACVCRAKIKNKKSWRPGQTKGFTRQMLPVLGSTKHIFYNSPSTESIGVLAAKIPRGLRKPKIVRVPKTPKILRVPKTHWGYQQCGTLRVQANLYQVLTIQNPGILSVLPSTRVICSNSHSWDHL